MDNLVSLREIYEQHKHGCDKGTAHSYIDVYEDLLKPFRVGASVLEIGLWKGYSLRMWEDYFVDSWVGGIDISDKYLKPMMHSHHVVILDATDESAVAKVFGGRTFSVIIDDGSHALQDQVKTYSIFKKYLCKDSIYVIEDIARIARHAKYFLALDPTKTIQILDRRTLKGRRDDVMVILKGTK